MQLFWQFPGNASLGLCKHNGAKLLTPKIIIKYKFFNYFLHLLRFEESRDYCAHFNVLGSFYFYPSAPKKCFQRVIKFMSSQMKISWVTGEHCLLAYQETKTWNQRHSSGNKKIILYKYLSRGGGKEKKKHDAKQRKTPLWNAAGLIKER